MADLNHYPASHSNSNSNSLPSVENTQLRVDRNDEIRSTIFKRLVEAIKPEAGQWICDPFAGSASSIHLATAFSQCTKPQWQDQDVLRLIKESYLSIGNVPKVDSNQKVDCIVTCPPYQSFLTPDDYVEKVETCFSLLRPGGWLSIAIPAHLYDDFIWDYTLDRGNILFEESFEVSSTQDELQRFVILAAKKRSPEGLRKWHRERCSPIIGRRSSNLKVWQALKESKKRLIIVCPWISNNVVNNRMMRAFEEALKRGVQIDIGWGYEGDFNGDFNPSNYQSFAEMLDDFEFLRESWKYSAIPKLWNLEKKYPKNLKLTFLKTHAKYLICDSQWAMLGSHNFLLSGYGNDDDKNTTDEVGMQILQQRSSVRIYIQHFENTKKRLRKQYSRFYSTNDDC